MQEILETVKKYAVRLALLAALLLAVGFPTSLQAGTDQEAKKIFEEKCVRCHGEDGSGNAVIGKALGAADLRSDAVQKKSDADFYTQIEKGKGNMPPFGPSLEKTQINELVAYVRAFGKNQAAKKKQ
jgi:mono/diheme cytochrome c family protein